MANGYVRVEAFGSSTARQLRVFVTTRKPKGSVCARWAKMLWHSRATIAVAC